MTDLEIGFFDAYKKFLDDNDRCPDGPEHLRTTVWLPKGMDHCSVKFICICGARVVLPANRRVGRCIVAANRQQGIPVAEFNGPEVAQ